jgi:hypothetical protein
VPLGSIRARRTKAGHWGFVVNILQSVGNFGEYEIGEVEKRFISALHRRKK